MSGRTVASRAAPYGMAVNRLFSAITLPIVGIVLALVAFEGLKHGLLLPLCERAVEGWNIHSPELKIFAAHVLLVAGLVLCVFCIFRYEGVQQLTKAWTLPVWGIVLALILFSAVRKSVLQPACERWARELVDPQAAPLVGSTLVFLLLFAATLAALAIYVAACPRGYTARKNDYRDEPPHFPEAPDGSVEDSAEIMTAVDSHAVAAKAAALHAGL